MTTYTLLDSGYVLNNETGEFSLLSRHNHISQRVLDELIAAGCAKEDTRSGLVLPVPDGVTLIQQATTEIPEEAKTPSKKKAKAS